MKHLFFISICLIGIFVSPYNAYAKSNYYVTPIKYELEAEPGETLYLKSTIINKGSQTQVLEVGKSDFMPVGKDGKPRFIRKSELNFPQQQLSSWMNTPNERIEIEPLGKKDVYFSIDIPQDASPGSHYGAFFFQDKNRSLKKGHIGVNVDYGILVLVKVNGDIVIESNIDIPLVEQFGFGTLNNDDLNSAPVKTSIKPPLIDNCIIDFSPSPYDKSCFFAHSTPKIDGSPQVEFQINIKNIGNTHFKPEGKIYLYDPSGTQLKNIGEKLITNDFGVVTGKEIVDYLPINNEEGNVLPGSTRMFRSDWKGIITSHDAVSNTIEYTNYEKSLKPEDTKKYLQFWEKSIVVTDTIYLNAKTFIRHLQADGSYKEVEYASVVPYVFTQEVIVLNRVIGVYAVIILALTTTALIIGKIIFGGFRRCRGCKKKISKKYKVCPFCKTRKK